MYRERLSKNTISIYFSDETSYEIGKKMSHWKPVTYYGFVRGRSLCFTVSHFYLYSLISKHKYMSRRRLCFWRQLDLVYTTSNLQMSSFSTPEAN